MGWYLGNTPRVSLLKSSMSQSNRRFRALRDRVVATICVVAIVLSVARLALNWESVSRGLQEPEALLAQAVEFTRRNSTPGEFDPMVPLPPVTPITDAPFIRASDSTEEQVTDNELVLGLEIGVESRAYPINMLTGPRREIINDTLGGRRIAATW